MNLDPAMAVDIRGEIIRLRAEQILRNDRAGIWRPPLGELARQFDEIDRSIDRRRR